MPVKLLPKTPQAYDYPLLIKRLFMSAERFGAGKEICYRNTNRFSYPQFCQRVRRLAAALQQAGVQAGDTLAVLDWDSHRYLECYFAIPMLGAVLHHVNVRLSPEQIHYTMEHAEDTLVLVHDDFAPLLSSLHSRLPQVRGYIRLSDDDSSQVADLPYLGEYEQLLDAATPLSEFADFSEDAIATTFYTTGTTGNPKGVFFSHRQLVLHTLNMVGMLGSYDALPLLRSDSVYMPITPMFHVHAWGVPYAATMLGVKQVYPGRYEPNALVQLIEQEQVTFSHCVPTILQMLLGCEAGQQADLSQWKILIGGSAFPRGLAKHAQERGIDIYSAYGMSETCPLLTITHLSPEERHSSADQQLQLRTLTGIPANMVDLRIVDAEGKVVAADGSSMGEVQVRAPWLTQGYLKEPEKSAELWQDGWLHTGDVACQHANGFVEIKDRIKDVIKTGGEWISSIALENLISQHPQVAAVAVVGIPDERWGERPYALVVKRQDSLTAEQLQQHLQQYVTAGELSKWAIPEHFLFVEDLPKTSVGKINKKLIRQQAQQ
ncbi:fatty acid--CoA ligase [Balneatrix alpica]|uniref:Fatty acid--CoA ligase n=1 Tax=Balneatrix alpica TaxID=75684 RepID=A0ABV5ZB65_9GAMM|nr:fatty acid--CoA ligase [Balneatrix alpica]